MNRALTFLILLASSSPELKLSAAETTKASPIPIASCCTSISSSSALLDARAQIDFSLKIKNPYMTTWERDKFSVQITENQDFSYSPPQQLGNSQQIPQPLHFWVPNYPSKETTTFDKAPPPELYTRLTQILRPDKRYPSQNIDIHQITTYITNGSQSFVFFLHPPYPSKEESSQKKTWANSHSHYVIKLRKASPWNRGLGEAAKQIRRDIVIPALFTLCAKNYFIIENGKKSEFIKPVTYEEQSTRPQDGIFVQKTVFGKTAFYLAKQLIQAQQGDQAAMKTILAQGFSSLKQLERKLLLLEKFYQLTHKDVVNFQLANHIDGPSGVMPALPGSKNPQTLVIGFDFNQGQNVIWDLKEQIFKAIDF